MTAILSRYDASNFTYRHPEISPLKFSEPKDPIWQNCPT